MKQFAITSFLLMLIIISCTKKNEKSEIVVETSYKQSYICHVQKQDVPTSIYFSFSYKQEKSLTLCVMTKDIFDYWTRNNSVIRNSKDNEIKIPLGEETLHQLDLCLQHASNLYPIRNLNYIYGYTFMFGDHALLDSKKTDYYSFARYEDYCHAVDHALTKTPLYKKMNKLLYKYGLGIDTIKAANIDGRKYSVLSRKDIKEECNIDKNTYIPDSVLITPITITIKKLKGNLLSLGKLPDERSKPMADNKE